MQNLVPSPEPCLDDLSLVLPLPNKARCDQIAEVERRRRGLLLLFLVRGILRKQQPAQHDKSDGDTGDREPGSDLIHLMTP